jgi:hypothetical protein
MASSTQSVPDPLAAWLAHALVGMAAAAAIGPHTGPSGAIAAALIAVALHHALDAPVAKALSSVGV